MARLLIANGTFQNIDFHHRVPGFDKVFSTLVPAGRQVEHPVEMDEHQLDSVIQQLERFGGQPKSDVGSLSTPRGLVYSIDRPVSSDQIDAAREKDEEIRQEIADKQIENAGVAVPAVGDAFAKLSKAILEIKELAPTDREQVVKGGVDTRIEVSRDAGRRQRVTG